MVGHRRPPRPRHPLGRRVVARLVDRRRGPLASPQPGGGGPPVAGRLGRRWWRRPCGSPAATPCSGSTPSRGRPELGELVVVEVENQSPVPVAVAFALRPYNPEGLAAVGSIALEGTTVLVDGRPGLLLPRPPAGVAGSVLGRRRLRPHRHVPARPVPGPVDVEDPDGLGQAAFVYPLPHRTTLRVAMPLGHDGRPRRRSPGPPPARPPSRPAGGGRRPVAGAGRCDPGLAGAAPAGTAARAARPPAPVGRRRQPGRPAAVPHRRWHHAGALERRAGLVPGGRRHGGGARPLRLPRRGRRGAPGPAVALTPAGDSGSLRNWEAHAGALWAIAEHHRLTGDVALLGELIPAVRGGDAGSWPAITSWPSCPTSTGFWWLRGLVDGAWLLRLAGDGHGGRGGRGGRRPAPRRDHGLAGAGRRPPRTSRHAGRARTGASTPA